MRPGPPRPAPPIPSGVALFPLPSFSPASDSLSCYYLHLRQNKSATGYPPCGSRSRYWLPTSPTSTHLRDAILSLYRRESSTLVLGHPSTSRKDRASPIWRIFSSRNGVAHMPSGVHQLLLETCSTLFLGCWQCCFLLTNSILTRNHSGSLRLIHSLSEHIKLLLMAGFRANIVAL